MIFSPTNDLESLDLYYEEIFANPIVSFFSTLLTIIFIILSMGIGTLILDEKDRKIVSKVRVKDIKDSFRVFVFVVVPLLIIAGIIEGALITFLG